MKKPIQPTNQPASQFVDLIMCEYENGSVYLYPLKPNYEVALLECRVAMESGRYSAFTFLRATFPDETIQALNCLTQQGEHGPSKELKRIAPLPMELKEIIWQIAATKGILPSRKTSPSETVS